MKNKITIAMIGYPDKAIKGPNHCQEKWIPEESDRIEYVLVLNSHNARGVLFDSFSICTYASSSFYKDLNSIMNIVMYNLKTNNQAV